MGNTGRELRATPPSLLAWLAAAFLAACGANEQHKGSGEDPFAFVEIRQLATPPGGRSASPSRAAEPRDTTLLPQMGRERMLQISMIYDETLTQFESIYGDGVGPAKAAPDYLACKAAFRAVGARLRAAPIPPSTPAPLPGPAPDGLARALATCRAVAERWSGPAEMATFGNDLKAMAEGSLLVLDHALAASEAIPPRHH
jgi:hypothetical protein